MNTRLTVVVRRDLKLCPGLLAAQVAHISDQFMRNRISNPSEDVITFSKDQTEWTLTPYLSVLAVDTLDELEILYRESKEAGIHTLMWEDVIPSEILQRPVRVKVGFSMGPDDFDRIKLVTGTLPLY